MPAAANPLEGWDPDNGRFAMPSHCPYPDCAAVVEATANVREAVLGWCASCNRPYEAVPFQPSPDVSWVEINRRPDSIFCSQTGQPLHDHSLLDWCEAGGGPGRTHCQSDPLGVVFGEPVQRRTLRLEEDWEAPSVLADRDEEAEVTSISVVRGRVVAATLRGSLTILDAMNGALITPRPLLWQPSLHEPAEAGWRVDEPPACRGTNLVLAAPHEAQFRDLLPFLFPQRGSASRQCISVHPSAGSRFVGPPLGIRTPQGPAFCLLEARDESAADAARLRFFAPAGQELASCPAPGIARPPAFDDRLERVVWVDAQGGIATLPTAEIRPGATLKAALRWPDPMLHLAVDMRPTFALTTGSAARRELWLASHGPDDSAEMHQVVLDELLAAPTAAWSWMTQRLARVGEPIGMAVGRGPMHRANAAARLVGLATHDRVLSLDRSNLATAGRSPAVGHEGTVGGSYEAPIVCSAGVVSRLGGSLCVDTQGIGWNDASFQLKVTLPGIYEGRQGMAMFGRRIYIGYGPGVKSYRLAVTETT